MSGYRRGGRVPAVMVLFTVSYLGADEDGRVTVELFDRQSDAVRRCDELVAGGVFALVQSHGLA